MYRALGRYWSEVKEATTLKGIDYREEKMLWDFRKEEAIKQWSCICDEEKGGYSRTAFGPNKKGIIREGCGHYRSYHYGGRHYMLTITCAHSITV